LLALASALKTGGVPTAAAAAQKKEERKEKWFTKYPWN
jgi:hypothetical protein